MHIDGLLLWTFELNYSYWRILLRGPVLWGRVLLRTMVNGSVYWEGRLWTIFTWIRIGGSGWVSWLRVGRSGVGWWFWIRRSAGIFKLRVRWSGVSWLCWIRWSSRVGFFRVGRFRICCLGVRSFSSGSSRSWCGGCCCSRSRGSCGRFVFLGSYLWSRFRFSFRFRFGFVNWFAIGWL